MATINKKLLNSKLYILSPTKNHPTANTSVVMSVFFFGHGVRHLRLAMQAQ